MTRAQEFRIIAYIFLVGSFGADWWVSKAVLIAFSFVWFTWGLLAARSGEGTCRVTGSIGPSETQEGV